MRFSQAPPTLLSLLVVSLSSTVTAGPFPRDVLHDLGFSFLMNRNCISYCGMDNQYCCTAGQACYTVGAIAGCSATPAANVATAAGGYQEYTLTVTETGLIVRTTTSTSWYQAATSWVAAPAPTVANTPAICREQGQTSCGRICCASFQVCGGPDTCIPRPESSYFPPLPVPVPTTVNSFSAPFRPTSSGILTSTFTVAPTTTAPFLAPATASGSLFPTAIAATGGGLSPGAIAGIVIGVIAGIILLILICFCCIVKAGFDGLLAIFGLGKRKRRSTERIETVEHYSRHGSHAGSRRESHGGWFGGKPSRVDSSRKKKSSGFGGLGAVGAGLAGLALVLGLKRKNDKEKPARSDISSSYYTDSYTGTSASSASSDRRTRDSRRPPPR